MIKHKKALACTAILTSGTATLIAVINQIIAASSALKNILTTKEGYIYSWKFGDVYYTRTGHGRAILLVHDLNVCDSAVEWHKIIHELEKKYTVYAIDLPGCGRSEKPKMTYTNFLYVQLLTDFVRDIIKEKTHVIATGLSASFVIATSQHDKSIFNKIMLISPMDPSLLNQSPTKKSKTAKFIIELPLIGTLLYNILMTRSNMELLFTEEYLYNPFRTEEHMIDAYYEAAHKGRPNGKYLQSSISGRFVYTNISRALREIDNSIYIISGDKTPSIQQIIALYQTFNPSIEYELIPMAKKMPHLEHPEKVLETVKIFFADQQ